MRRELSSNTHPSCLLPEDTVCPAPAGSCPHDLPLWWTAPWNCEPKQTPFLPYVAFVKYSIPEMYKVTNTVPNIYPIIFPKFSFQGIVVHPYTNREVRKEDWKVSLGYIGYSRQGMATFCLKQTNKQTKHVMAEIMVPFFLELKSNKMNSKQWVLETEVNAACPSSSPTLFSLASAMPSIHNRRADDSSWKYNIFTK